jgi:signal transduction histidine kinase
MVSANLILMVMINLFDPGSSQALGNLYFIVVPSIFTLLSIFLAIKAPPQERKILWVFAAFAVFRTIAEITWVVFESVLFIDTFPSIIDFFYLAGYFFILVFLFQYLAPVRRAMSNQVKIIATVVAMAHLIPTGTSVYLLNPGSNFFEFIVSLAYPIGDAAFLWLVTAGLTLLFNKKHNLFLTLLMGGVIGFIVSDTLFVFMTDSYQVGSLIDLGWLAGYMLFIFAALSYAPLSKNDTSQIVGKKPNGLDFETIIKFVIPLITITTIFVAGAVIISQYFSDMGEGDTTGASYNLYVIPLIIGVFTAIIFIQNKNLLKFVKMRTIELELERNKLQAEVDEKVIMLMKSERFSAIGELSARIAHDLRNPLTIIKTGLEIIKIKDPVFTKDTQDTLSRIDRALVRIVHQIDNVLDFVSPKPLLIKSITLSELLKLTVDRVEIPDGVSITLPKNDFEFKCDSYQMEIVLVNLITNSIQAMENKGQVTLHGSKSSKEVILQVQDTGPGIPYDLLSKVFDPLFTTRFVGTGLGLPSCKTIAEKHGGTILINTEMGKGTTFSIIIPNI